MQSFFNVTGGIFTAQLKATSEVSGYHGCMYTVINLTLIETFICKAMQCITAKMKICMAPYHNQNFFPHNELNCGESHPVYKQETLRE